MAFPLLRLQRHMINADTNDERRHDVDLLPPCLAAISPPLPHMHRAADGLPEVLRRFTTENLPHEATLWLQENCVLVAHSAGLKWGDINRPGP